MASKSDFSDSSDMALGVEESGVGERLDLGRRELELTDTDESNSVVEVPASDDIGNELQRERHYIKGGITAISERADSKFRYYYAGLWPIGPLEQFEGIFSRLEKANKDLRFLYAWLDGNHVHVIHDCAYSNLSCRCFRVKLLGRKCKRKQLRELSEEEIDAIIDYYFKEPKTLIYGKTRVYVGAKHHDRVFYHRLIKNTPGPIMATRYYVAPSESVDEIFARHQQQEAECVGESSHTLHPELFEYDERHEESRKRKRSAGEEIHGLRYNRFNAICKKVEAKLKWICSAPISETINTQLWQLDEEFKYMQPKQGAIEAAINSAELWLRTLKLKELIKFIDSGNFAIGHPLWAATNEESFNRMYMSVGESYNILTVWILYQFYNFPVTDELEHEELNESNWLQVAEFIKELCLWFDGKHDRRYTYALIGQTKGGKTMFADVVMDLKINVGVMGNYNRNSSFPLNMCANKSMYYWNEPEIEPCALEEIKKIAGGDKHTVAVKHKNNRTQAQVQLLITANKHPFPRTEVFNSRCIYKTIQSAPFLKRCNGKRYHPLGLIKLIRACENVLEEEL